MLVLSRKKGETLCIGEDITVTVLSIESRGNVKIAINAPRIIEVDRKEIRELKEMESQS